MKNAQLKEMKAVIQAVKETGSNFIETRGIQEYRSPNGVYRLRISDSGIQRSTNGTAL